MRPGTLAPPRAAVAIAVMAKAPAPGRCKTRLIPHLSPDEAAALGAAFLKDVTANLALAAERAPVTSYIAFTPAGAERAFDGLLAPGTELLLADGRAPEADAPGVSGTCGLL